MKVYVGLVLDVDEEVVRVIEAAGYEVVNHPYACDLALLVTPEVYEVKELVAKGCRVVALESQVFGSTVRMRDWFRAKAIDVLDRPYTTGTELGRQLLIIIKEALAS